MSGASLYLRTDGSLMLAKGDVDIEIVLSPKQLATLGLDLLRVAISIEPECFDKALESVMFLIETNNEVELQ